MVKLDEIPEIYEENLFLVVESKVIWEKWNQGCSAGRKEGLYFFPIQSSQSDFYRSTNCCLPSEGKYRHIVLVFYRFSSSAKQTTASRYRKWH